MFGVIALWPRLKYTNVLRVRCHFPFRCARLGQQLVYEILDAQRAGCPPEYFNIPIPKGNPLFDPEGHGGRVLPFLRTRYDMRTGKSPHAPREQVGENYIISNCLNQCSQNNRSLWVVPL